MVQSFDVTSSMIDEIILGLVVGHKVWANIWYSNLVRQVTPSIVWDILRALIKALSLVQETGLLQYGVDVVFPVASYLWVIVMTRTKTGR